MAENGAEISEDEIEETLILSIQKHPILYDCTSNNTKTRLAKETAWNIVAGDVQKPVEWCKLKWAKLREAYRKRKISLRNKSKSARKRTESWTHFASLQFLNDYLLEATTIGKANAMGEPTFDEMPSAQEILDETSDSNSDVLEPQENSNATTNTVKLQPRKRKRDELHTEILRFLNRPQPVQDENDLFCLGLAQQMKKMNPQTSTYLKMRISQVVHEMSVLNQLGAQGTPGN